MASPLEDLEVERDPFLTEEPRRAGSRNTSTTSWQEKTLELSVRMVLAWIFVSLLLAGCVCYLAYRRGSQSCSFQRDALLPSPARAALELQNVFLVTSRNTSNPFTGEPRPELDRAWHDLMQSATIRVSQADLDHLGLDSIALADGSGYIAQLGVFHELHCLKKLRQFMYGSHYYPNRTDFELERDTRHADHCLEYLRATSMCHADVSLTSFYYEPDPLDPLQRPRATERLNTRHECYAWEKLHAWSKARAVDLLDAGSLKPPR